MTRGTFYILTNKNLLWSTEFNGDMYPDGHGRLALELLERVENQKQFTEMIKYFNKINHGYKGKMVFKAPISELTLDFGKDYFDHWFSDWIFIKNLSKKTYTFKLREGKKTVDVKPGKCLVVNFGRLPDEKDLKNLIAQTRY